MHEQIPEHIYLKQDIDRAFNMGLEVAVAVFEKSLGLSYANQKLLLGKLKELLVKDKVETALNSRRY